MKIRGAPRQVHRVVAFLDRDQVDFLDRVGKDALFSTGVKFPRTKIIAALIDLLREANITGEGMRTERELAERVLRGFRAMPAGEVAREHAA